jgi:peptidoglycan/xylan/chitin deacetylase (PgdA/CDA1 family)
MAAILSLGGSAAAAFKWPGGAPFAVSLSYDDSLQSQLLNAIPALDKAGMHGTFFLSGQPYRDPAALAPWIKAAKAGHELASHTVSHPCPAEMKLPAAPLESFDLKAMEAELLLTAKVLGKLAPKTGLTFAFPCGADYVGQGEKKASFRPLTAAIFKASRNAWGGAADPLKVDLNAVPAVGGDHELPELLAQVEAAKKAGAWLVFVFHGVGGDYLALSSEAHQKLLEALKASGAWVAPFSEAAAWVREGRKQP